MLTERRKADRAKMANELASRLREAGAVVEIEPEGSSSICPRRVMLRVSVTDGVRTATIGVDFDGQSCQPDTHVATWNTQDRACFSDAMKGWTLNQFHFGKATRVCEGFEALASELVCDVMRLASGEGFSLERERDQRRKYAERGWP
jgi:hypothetical protein